MAVFSTWAYYFHLSNFCLACAKKKLWHVVFPAKAINKAIFMFCLCTVGISFVPPGFFAWVHIFQTVKDHHNQKGTTMVPDPIYLSEVWMSGRVYKQYKCTKVIQASF